MNRWFALWIMVAALVLPAAAQDRQPVIVFDSLTKDVGRVNEGDTIKHVFRFANKGQAQLSILDVEHG
jgi:hypothetical protein